MAAEDIILRLRAIGGRQAAAEIGAVSGATRNLETTSKRATPAAARLGKASAGASAGMATIGRVGKAGIAGVGIALGGAAVSGLKFNARMEQSRVAFTQLLGSGSRADAMLNRLAKTAKTTPFELQGLTKYAQQLLGTGTAAKDVIPTMKTLGDAVAGTGGGQEELAGVTRALTQIQTQGRLSTEELNQMSERGIPAFKILQQQMGVTGATLRKQIQGGAISSDKAIAALLAGMRKRYGGMSAAQSKTVNGMLSNLKDSAQQTFGALTAPLFKGLRSSVLPAILQISNGIQSWAQGGGVTTFLGKLKPLTSAVGSLLSAFKPLGPLISNVIGPLLQGFATSILAGIVIGIRVAAVAIRILATGLGFIGKAARPLRGVFRVIGGILGAVFGPAILRVVGFLLRGSKIFRTVANVGRALGRVIRGVAGVFSGLARGVGRVGNTLLGFAKTAVGVGKRVANALISPIRGAVSGIMRLGGRFLAAGKHIASSIGRGIAAAFRGGVGFVANIGRDLANWLNDNTPLGNRVNAGPIHFTLPELATGGVIQRGGAAIVGERGPELVNLPTGSSVYDAGQTRAALAPSISGGGGTVATTANFYLDRKLIATAVAREAADRRARR